MTDTSARLSKAIADAGKGDNTLYTIILYWVFSMRGITVEDCSHDVFVEITNDARRLKTIIERNYVICETADEIFINEFSRCPSELGAYSAMLLSDEIGVTINEARALVKELREHIAHVPHEPR